jgi:hypothetical protein
MIHPGNAAAASEGDVPQAANGATTPPVGRGEGRGKGGVVDPAGVVEDDASHCGQCAPTDSPRAASQEPDP